VGSPKLTQFQIDPEAPGGFDYVVCEATFGDTDGPSLSTPAATRGTPAGGSSGLNISDFEANAVEVADILRALANERRLMILCKLVKWDEGGVNSLANAVGLSASAPSQHLAKMRDEGLVTFRRESQTIWYRVADPRIEKLPAALL
jgi:ArsR family transcriptional regulator, virulence genes transcriptional regulator